MGNQLSEPKNEKEQASGAGNKLKFALSSCQGWRNNQEDSHITAVDLKNEKLDGCSLFMVFDGHGGIRLSKDCEMGFQDHFVSEIAKVSDLSNKDDVEKAIIDLFLSFDKSMNDRRQNYPNPNENPYMECGCTATGVFVTPHFFVFMNLGDSRSVLINKNSVKFTTLDHKPGDEDETKRITAAGGTVEDPHGGTGPLRVDGGLAVSRALGDFYYKNNPDLDQASQKVSCVPVVNFVERSSENNFMLIACDGIYDVATNEELNEFLQWKLDNSKSDEVSNLQDIADNLLDVCLAKDSKDNMSAILIKFDDSKFEKTENKIDTEKYDPALKELTDFIKDDLKDAPKDPRPIAGEYTKKLSENDKFNVWSDLVPGMGIFGVGEDIRLTIKDIWDEKEKAEKEQQQ